MVFASKRMEILIGDIRWRNLLGLPCARTWERYSGFNPKTTYLPFTPRRLSFNGIQRVKEMRGKEVNLPGNCIISLLIIRFICREVPIFAAKL